MPKQLMRMYLVYIILFSFIGSLMFFGVDGDGSAPQMTTAVIGDTKKSTDNVNVINSKSKLNTTSAPKPLKETKVIKEEKKENKILCNNEKVVNATLLFLKSKGVSKTKNELCKISNVIYKQNKDMEFSILFFSLIYRESTFNEKAIGINKKNRKYDSIGYAQIVPDKSVIKREYSRSDLFIGEKNVECGVRYFMYLKNKYNDTYTNTLRRYNGNSTTSKSTVAYSNRITQTMQQIRSYLK